MAELNRGVLSSDQKRAQQPAWSAQLDRDGKAVPDCWVTDGGYKVAKASMPEPRFMITRPGDAAAFAYTDLRGDVVKLIAADVRASAVFDQVQTEGEA